MIFRAEKIDHFLLRFCTGTVVFRALSHTTRSSKPGNIHMCYLGSCKDCGPKWVLMKDILHESSYSITIRF